VATPASIRNFTSVENRSNRGLHRMDTEMKTQIKVHLPTGAPERSILPLVLARLPRLIT
jgi:hypothetical protein